MDPSWELALALIHGSVLPVGRYRGRVIMALARGYVGHAELAA